MGGTMDEKQYAITMDDIRAAADRMRGLVHETPVCSAFLDNIGAVKVAIRCKHVVLHPTGAAIQQH